MVQSPLFRWKSILHFIWKSRSQSLEDEWRGTESTLFEVECEVSTVSDDLGCHVICCCWSTVFSEVHSQRRHLPGNFRALHTSFCWQSFMEMLISFSSRTWHLPTLPKVPKAGSMTIVLLCLIGQQTRLTNISCQEEDERHQTQQCRWPEVCYQSNLGFHYTWAVPQAEFLHATPHWCSNSCKRRPNQVLSA